MIFLPNSTEQRRRAVSLRDKKQRQGMKSASPQLRTRQVQEALIQSRVADEDVEGLARLGTAHTK
jgi:hypothetical protein